MYIRRSLAALTLLVSVAAFADAGKVNGTLTMNGNVAKLKYAYAVTRPDPFDKKKTVTCVIASDIELPQTALLDDMELMSATMKTPMNGLQWLINDENLVDARITWHTHGCGTTDVPSTRTGAVGRVRVVGHSDDRCVGVETTWWHNGRANGERPADEIMAGDGQKHFALLVLWHLVERHDGASSPSVLLETCEMVLLGGRDRNGGTASGLCVAVVFGVAILGARHCNSSFFVLPHGA